ncbi:MAG TPA: dihydrofolate reductase [Clostridia bacterium]|nr:dihydrofolate reductase [Clostridia bacterium]
MISLIWAMDSKRTIGRDNKLPWRLPADRAYFKKLTVGHKVIMGRRTYESIGKPLPSRENIVITSDTSYNAEGCLVCNNPQEALRLASGEEAFVIGGAKIYSEFLPYADRLYITQIEDTFDGDVFFDELDLSSWRLVSKTKGETNEKNPYEYYFLFYEKNK